MSHTISELRTKSDAELIEKHDRLSEHTIVGTDYYLQELARRNAASQTTAMLKFTSTINRLTWAITTLTALNVFLVGWDVFG